MGLTMGCVLLYTAVPCCALLCSAVCCCVLLLCAAVCMLSTYVVSHDRAFMENCCTQLLELDHAGFTAMHPFGGAGSYDAFKQVGYYTITVTFLASVMHFCCRHRNVTFGVLTQPNVMHTLQSTSQVATHIHTQSQYQDSSGLLRQTGRRHAGRQAAVLSSRLMTHHCTPLPV